MQAAASLMTSLQNLKKQRLKVSGTHVGVPSSPPTYLGVIVVSTHKAKYGTRINPGVVQTSARPLL